MRVYGLAMNPADLDAIEKMLRVTYLAPGIADAFAKLRKERDAMLTILITQRSALICENLHHCKQDQHAGLECPVEQAIDAAIGDKP